MSDVLRMMIKVECHTEKGIRRVSDSVAEADMEGQQAGGLGTDAGES